MATILDELHLCFKLREQNLSNGTEDNQLEDSIKLLQTQLDVDHVLWPLMLPLCVVSALVSVVNTVVLCRNSMLRSSMNVLLTALELSNIVLAVSEFTFAVLLVLWGEYVTNIHLATFQSTVEFLTFATAYFINWLTVFIGVWRLVAVVWPLKAASLLTKGRTIFTIIFIAFISCLPCILFGLAFQVQEDQLSICTSTDRLDVTNVTYYTLSDRFGRVINDSLLNDLILFCNIFYYLLPCICLLMVTSGLVFNIFQYTYRKKILREGQRTIRIEAGQTRTTLILIIMLFAFLISNSLPLVFRIMWLYGKGFSDYVNYFITNTLNRYPLSLLTNSFSIFAYYYMGTKFRETFRGLIGVRNNSHSQSSRYINSTFSSRNSTMSFSNSTVLYRNSTISITA